MGRVTVALQSQRKSLYLALRKQRTQTSSTYMQASSRLSFHLLDFPFLIPQRLFLFSIYNELHVLCTQGPNTKRIVNHDFSVIAPQNVVLP